MEFQRLAVKEHRTLALKRPGIGIGYPVSFEHEVPTKEEIASYFDVPLSESAAKEQPSASQTSTSFTEAPVQGKNKGGAQREGLVVRTTLHV